MNVVGIIAEYNPFHRGHAYQLQRIRETVPQAAVVIMMSGYFCQRGEPALVSPRARAAMALSAGADLVLQLPVCASAASAEPFASAGTRLLAATGICDYLCFGSESGDLTAARQIADILIQDEDKIFALMEEQLKSGQSYAAARQQAVIRLTDSAEWGDLLSSPNDILAIEYLKAIRRYHLKLEPLMIERIGCAEHQAAIPDTAQLNCPSALSIRTRIRELRYEASFPFNLIVELSPFIPAEPLALLLDELNQHGGADLDDFADPLYSLIERDSLTGIRYLDQEMAARLRRQVRSFSDHYPPLDELVRAAATKQLPLARVKRALISLLLNIPADEVTADAASFACHHYLHVLGFNRRGRYLLKQMRSQADLPVITSFSRTAALSEEAAQAAAWDRTAARLWLGAQRQPLNQFLESPLEFKSK